MYLPYTRAGDESDHEPAAPAGGLCARGVGRLIRGVRGAAEQLFAAHREGLRWLLADWSPEQYAEVGELLTRLSRAVLGAYAGRRVLSC